MKFSSRGNATHVQRRLKESPLIRFAATSEMIGAEK